MKKSILKMLCLTLVAFMFASSVPLMSFADVAQQDIVIVQPAPVVLGTGISYFKVDDIYVSEIILDEMVPLGDALPQSGQLPMVFFLGLGGLIFTIGVFLRKSCSFIKY